MERKEFEPYLKAAFETPPFSFALAGNLMAILKQRLVEENIRDFPVIALTGAPGSGKTSVARACLAGHEKEFLFTDKVSAVKKELSKSKMQDKYILLDDCADFASQSARQKASSLLDEIARGSYNGGFPVMAVTVEENALARITPSCRMRMIEVPVDTVLKDDRDRGILDYLETNQTRLLGLLAEFRAWHQAKQAGYCYRNLLREFRERYREKDARSTSLFFMYFVSMQVFSDFTADVYHVKISMQRIEENFEAIWEKQECSVLSRKELVKRLFQSLIDDGAFKPTFSSLGCKCAAYYDGRCTDPQQWDVDDCEECYHGEDPGGYYYDPRELLLGSENGAAVLIEKGSYIYQYPTYCDGETPLLIVSDNELLTFMNDELHKFCIEKSVHLQWFGPKELHQLLFDSNMCMYNYISNKHKTYVFKYERFLKPDISVMILRLTQEQYLALKKAAKRPVWISGMITPEDQKELCYKLKQIGNSIHGRAGE